MTMGYCKAMIKYLTASYISEFHGLNRDVNAETR